MGIWPEQSGPNFLLYQTKVVQYLKEIRDSMGSGFQNIINEGELAEESLRGVCFNILDVELHPDSIHRGDGQIIPTIRRVYYAEDTATPRYEEQYLCDISTPSEIMSGDCRCFSQRRRVMSLMKKMFRHIYLSLNLSGSLLILEAWLLDKLSHNEYFLIGILLIKILLMWKAYEITMI